MKNTIRKIALFLAVMLAVLGAGVSYAENTTYDIGIIQLVQHPALDSASQGFMDALIEKLGKENVDFLYDNAQGDSANCATIVNGFIAADVDLILGNATAALQAAFAATETTPILGTSITDYVTALDLDDFDGTTGFNVSGTSDLAPLADQAAMLAELCPVETYPTVGLLYCSAEPNSLFQINVIEPILKDMGYETERFTFSDSNDIASVTTNACASSSLIYVPTDNVVASNTEVINNVALPAGVPIIAGEESACAGCGIASLSINYYDLGYATGEMAYEILVNGADVSAMPIEYAPQVAKKYNAANCAELGITIPEGYEVIEGTEIAE